MVTQMSKLTSKNFWKKPLIVYNQTPTSFGPSVPLSRRFQY